jgi:protein associated with RNAse G/E
MSPHERWPPLPTGTALTVVKQSPDGSEATRYAAAVIDAAASAPWIAIEAIWNHRAYDLDGLLFLPGDTLHEFFSPAHWFNVFAVFAPDGTLRGWYANVTYPARLDHSASPPVLTWHDLYLDVVLLPAGDLVVRDEDELAEANVEATAPELHERIVIAREELLRRARQFIFPFHERGIPARKEI